MLNVNVTVYIDPEDVLDELTDDDILEYLKDERSIEIKEDKIDGSDSRRIPPQNLREKLCDMFDMAAMSSKEEIIDYIKSAI